MKNRRGELLGIVAALSLFCLAAVTQVNLATQVQGILGTSNGGTGSSGAPGCSSSCSFVIGGPYPWPSTTIQTGAAVGVANVLHVSRFSVPAQMKLGATAVMFVSTGAASSHVGAAVYDSGGTRQWTTGAQSSASSGAAIQVSGVTPFTLQPGVAYYLASCSTSTSVVMGVVQGANATQAGLYGNGTAHTYGTDATDTCSAGAPPASITTTNITNQTASAGVEVTAVLVTN